MFKLKKFIGLLCVAMLLCQVSSMARSVINETFDNTTLTNILGEGKLFASGSSAGFNDVSIETETNGNKYLQIKPSSSQKVLLTSAGVINEGITTISARMKFNGGNTTGLILRYGQNQTYIAVNNGGGTALRLFNNSATALTIDYNKWYDVFYKIDLKAGTIYGKIKPTGSNTGIESAIAVPTGSVNANSHIRIISDGSASAQSKGVCIDNFVVSDKYEPTYLVNETFDQYNLGKVSNILFSPESGLGLIGDTYRNNVSVVQEETGKSLKVTGTQNIGEPLLYTSLVPSGKSILSFDLMTNDETYEFRAFIQTNSSNRKNIMQYYNSPDNSVADFVSVLGRQDKFLGERIKSEFLHFVYIIDKGNGKTTVTGYVNGEYFGTDTLNVEYSSIRFDVNPSGIPSGVDGTKSVMYLDNYKLYQPGLPQMSFEVPKYISNGDYITLKANNVINPDTLRFNCPEGVSITPETDDGKEYRLVFDGLVKNEDYEITTDNICDLYGQAFETAKVSFKSVEAPDVETDITYKIDGIAGVNGKFAPGDMEVSFGVMSNTARNINLKGYIVLYGDGNKCLGLKGVDIPVPAREKVTVSDGITVSDSVKKIKVVVWRDDMKPVCEEVEILPYTYDEIESVCLYYPGYTNKAVTFSYDDGIMGTDEILIELFNKYNMKGTFNVVGDFVPEDEAELEKYKLLYKGHEVANHSQTHPKINLESSGMTIKLASEDILKCRDTIKQVFENDFDTTKWGFVWPYARPAGRLPESDIPFVEELEQNIAEMGAVYIRPVTTTGKFDLPENWMLWEPTSKDDDMERYTDEFLADTKDGLRLLYLWGHSTDLYSKKYGMGFEDLEETFKKLTAEGVNIWSATNMEIYDYVNAAENIEVSEDKTKVYNSSDVDVYAVINGQKVIIPANGYTAL